MPIALTIRAFTLNMYCMRHAILLLYRLIAQLGLLLVFYTAFRLCFYAFNVDFFELDAGGLLRLLVAGIRFDLSAVLLLNSLFILLSVWPYPRQDASRILAWRYGLFMIPNSLAVLFEVSDWEYYAFNRKRSTAGVFDMLGLQGDFLSLLPAFLKDFWYLFLIAALAIVALSLGFKRIEARFALKFFLLKWGQELLPSASAGKQLIGRLLIFISVIGATLIGIRGGLQLVPINLRNALEVARPDEAPLVLNTPFSILHSLANTTLQEVHFMDSTTAWSLTAPLKQYPAEEGFKPKNVVIIILESFSRSFTALGGGTSYTPFLDSLMTRSRTFTQAFANGLHSADAVPAILAGIPALMSEPFGTSMYSNNALEALPLLLKQQGYYSAFFHGAANGSMSFDIFARSAGYDAYFGRSEYPDPRDYDGNWGIYDGPFFQFFGRCLDTMRQPFHATLFSLSSHHPFSLPEPYKAAQGIREQSIFTTVQYTDAALARFFREAAQKDWFLQTLFVVVADHVFPDAIQDKDQSRNGRYRIPLLFYAPGDSLMSSYDPTPVQQMDILPGILDYLNYPHPFFALGNSPFDTAADRVVIQHWNEGYQWISKGYQVEYFADSIRSVYAYPGDSLQTHNLLPGVYPENAVRQGQALIQVYQHAMLQDKMCWRQLRDSSLIRDALRIQDTSPVQNPPSIQNSLPVTK